MRRSGVTPDLCEREVGVMPKERIFGNPSAMFNPVVGWRPDGSVQLGVESSGGYSLMDIFYGGVEDYQSKEHQRQIQSRMVEILVEKGMVKVPSSLRTDEEKDQFVRETARAVLDAVTGSATGMDTGVWADLDRRMINDTIRVLRKARDSAYGRDE